MQISWVEVSSERASVNLDRPNSGLIAGRPSPVSYNSKRTGLSMGDFCQGPTTHDGKWNSVAEFAREVSALVSSVKFTWNTITYELNYYLDGEIRVAIAWS